MFFFSPEDRGVCYASDVTHTRLAWFRSFLIVAAQDKYKRMVLAAPPPPSSLSHMHLGSRIPHTHVPAQIWPHIAQHL